MVDVINEGKFGESDEGKALAVSAHESLGTLPNALKELWFEIGGSCHLRCKYCFACSGGVDSCKDNLSIDQTMGFLNEFVKNGGERIGVVGAGEPFHPNNIGDLFAVLEFAKAAGVKTTVFTTGDLITGGVIDRLDGYPNIVLLIKLNSQNPDVQDALVNSSGYSERRDAGLQRLMRRGYNDGKRLGMVTSIMGANKDEMADLLRYSRRNNLIFDADSLIPRGRGAECGLGIPSDEMMETIETLRTVDAEEFGNVWEFSSNYIASPPCTRFNQHLYVSKTGTVHPCVGSTTVLLGNVKEQKLMDVWNSDAMRIIRSHAYAGKCTTCENFNTNSRFHTGKRCYSCLARSTETECMTTEFITKNRFVQTRGCFGYKPMGTPGSDPTKQTRAM
ncbi:Coenzyme PQQ synthesis protein E [uncultured archaeon]|nr:Coenzyme PQQ synthesis protein E [uncultured archaeon]